MISFKHFFLILGVIRFTYGAKFRCDYEYSPDSEGWFKLHQVAAPWKVALRTCLDEGASLANIDTEIMKSSMLDLMRHNDIERVATAESEVITNNCTSSDCKLLWSGGVVSTLKSNTAHNYYICFHSGARSIALNECGTIDDNYIKNPHTKTCHKWHSEPRDWFSASSACEAEGGTLAIVNDEEEAKVLNGLKGSINTVAFVGLLVDEGGRAHAVQKNELPKTNNSCGAIQNTYVFTAVDCFTAHQFICEKDPSSLVCDDIEINNDIFRTVDLSDTIVNGSNSDVRTSTASKIYTSTWSVRIVSVFLCYYNLR